MCYYSLTTGSKSVAGTVRFSPPSVVRFLGSLRDSTRPSPTSPMADGIKAVFGKRKAEVWVLRAALKTVLEYRFV